MQALVEGWGKPGPPLCRRLARQLGEEGHGGYGTKGGRGRGRYRKATVLRVQQSSPKHGGWVGGVLTCWIRMRAFRMAVPCRRLENQLEEVTVHTPIFALLLKMVGRCISFDRLPP